MPDSAIKFGTDGWRAVIADQYTYDNLELVTRATAQWLKKNYSENPKVVLGHDTRFQGRRFAEFTAVVFADENVRVTLADGFTTTPAISWAAEAYGCSAGIVITASHNPPEYNGFKIKAHFGGPATPAMIAAVEGELPSVSCRKLEHTFEDLVLNGTVQVEDVTSGYMDVLKERIDVDAIRKSNVKVAHDAMYGSGQGLLSRLLTPGQVVTLHHDDNPGFHGQAPEPIEKNLGELEKVIVEKKCVAGIANDGDADRVGMYDENGSFVSSHLLLALLVKYLHEEKGLTGDIVKTFSTTHMLDRMGEQLGLKVETTQIGFKYIASKIVEGDVLVGGEESGGMAVKGHIPERDGVYIGLLILEMMVKRGKKLSALVQELYDQYGPHYTYRIDAHTTEDNKQAILRRLKDESGLKRIAGHDIESFETLDGYKHVGKNGWLLVRPSGTEPVLRIYSEASTPEDSVAIVHDAMKQLNVG